MSLRTGHIGQTSERATERVGVIELSYFNLFWIFVIVSAIGLIGETAVSFVLDGHLESRAGLVIGPLSPIYGLGAVLITVALNHLDGRSPFTMLAVAGIVGGAFEYLAGFLLESAFGIVAWSYEGQAFSIGGHTSLLMMCVWGACGLAWMKFGLPAVMNLIDRIPQNARKQLTFTLSVLLYIDVALTIGALDCWYLRTMGMPIETPQQAFFAYFFDDSFMNARFETMSMWTVLAMR